MQRLSRQILSKKRTDYLPRVRNITAHSFARNDNIVSRSVKNYLKVMSPKDYRGKKRKLQGSARAEGTHEEVLLADVQELLGKSSLSADNLTQELPERFTEINVTVESISSTGDGIGRAAGYSKVFAVPFTAPGDVVKAKYIRFDETANCAIADHVSMVKASSHREESLVRCPYFGTCSGCQFQMLPYAYQLEHKRQIVERAYRNFSGLASKVVPKVGDTIGSPLQYGYRTKLTPHFDGPPGARRSGKHGGSARFGEVPPIGFMKKGTRKTLDIEECPIGTEAVQMGLRRERKRIVQEIDKYSRGATILLRESTERVARADADVKLGIDEERQIVIEERAEHLHIKRCVTDNKAITTEYVDDFEFKNLANSFFQNNNSILPVFTSYIREHVKSRPSRLDENLSMTTDPADPEIVNLIDAYCGSGLFTVTLSSLFTRSVGIDIDEGGITYARLNASLNASTPPPLSQSFSANPDEHSTTTISPDHMDPISSATATTAPTTPIQTSDPPIFLCATASALFTSVPTTFDPLQTVVIIDPPRKGCDEDFLRQLLAFGPARIVYVSCNVHTQARDVGWLLRDGRAEEKDGSKEMPGRYQIESLRGFDFFPQTGHVEGVAVLSRKRD